MAKARSKKEKEPHLTWTAEHRYGDVYKCSSGDRSLSHSVRGLTAAHENLADKDTSFAQNQLAIVEAKLEAINKLESKGAP